MRSFTRLLVVTGLAGGLVVAGVNGADAGTQCDGHAVTIDLNSMAPRGGGRATYYGTPGPDVILGTADGELIYALGGNDRICAGGGPDSVFGGGGLDRVFGGPGDDDLHQKDGGGLLVGGYGLDELKGGPGRDTLRGGQDSDTLFGYLGNDALDGGTGVSVILDPPDTASDTCNGGGGQDTQTRCEVSSNFP